MGVANTCAHCVRWSLTFALGPDILSFVRSGGGKIVAFLVFVAEKNVIGLDNEVLKVIHMATINCAVLNNHKSNRDANE